MKCYRESAHRLTDRRTDATGFIVCYLLYAIAKKKGLERQEEEEEKGDQLVNDRLSVI